MKYKKHYELLIEKARNRVLSSEVYTETHHIVPKCLGGDDSSLNLVVLTGREHYVAHLLLAKIYGGRCWHAVKLMGSRLGYTNRMYEAARKKHSSMLSASNRKTKRKPREERLYNCFNCGVSIVKIEFVHKQPREKYYCSVRCRNIVSFSKASKKGKPNLANRGKTPWNKGKSSPMKGKTIKGHTAWNKGKSNPLGSINGKKGAKKLSQTATGRKRRYLEGGKWTWEYTQNIGDRSPQ